MFAEIEPNSSLPKMLGNSAAKTLGAYIRYDMLDEQSKLPRCSYHIICCFDPASKGLLRTSRLPDKQCKRLDVSS